MGESIVRAESALVRLTAVRKSYSSTTGLIRVLQGVDLTIGRNARVAIVGPSGSGKSTLLNILGALDTTDGGEVMINGTDLSTLDSRERAKFRNHEVGFVFQMHLLLPQCTVLENVLVPSLIAEDPTIKSGAPERAKALLGEVGLGDRLDHFPDLLSGGERLRVALVRALVNRPSLILADEPTGSLDNQTADTIGDVLIRLNRNEGVTLVAVTHSERLAGRFDTVFRLENGVLTSCG